MDKITYKPNGWGVDAIEKDLSYLISLLNKKNLTKEEANLSNFAFTNISNYVEGLKEMAWGEDV